MNPASRWVVTLLAVMALFLGACDSSSDSSSSDKGGVDDPADPTGVWIVCRSEAGSYAKDTLEFAESDRMYYGLEDFGSDDTCSGTGTPTENGVFIYVVGAEISLTLLTETVTGYEIDVTEFAPPYGTRYTSYYIDTGANPDILYLGDETAEAGKDGASASARPTILQDDVPREYQK